MRVCLLALLLATLGPTAALAGEARWTPVGPPGGSVRALAADPSAPGRLYLGTPNGVLYRSDDEGLHWRRLEPGFPRRGCSLDQIAIDANGVLYVGFWDVAGHGGGVARSTDGGGTLELLREMDGESVRALAIAPTNPRRIAAGTLTGVFLSDDGGGHWRRISPAGDANLHNIASLAFDPAAPQVLYAGTWHLAWKTADAGAHWAPANSGMVDDSHVMTVNVDRRDRLVATACTGIYSSTDGGSRWTKLAGIPESSRRTRSFRQSPDDADFLLAGTTAGLWISENGGRAWRLATGRDLTINAVILQPHGTIVLGTDEQGVLRSPDRGRTWTPSNTGFTENLVSRLLFDRAGGRVIAAVRGARPNGDLYVAPGVRGPWTPFGQGLQGRRVLSLVSVDDTLFAGTDDGLFSRTRDASEWTRAQRRAGRKTQPRATELLALEGHCLLAATSAGLVVSSDRGCTWSSASDKTGEVYALAVSPADRRVMMAAARKGFFCSRDGGRSWRLVAPPCRDAIPHELGFVSPDGLELLATTSRGLLRSRDQGSTWEWVTAGIPPCDLLGLALSPDGLTVLASDFTRGGIFRSADGGRTWSRMTTSGLASDHVWMLAVDPTDPGRVLAAAEPGGLCLLESPPPVSAEAVRSQPRRSRRSTR